MIQIDKFKEFNKNDELNMWMNMWKIQHCSSIQWDGQLCRDPNHLEVVFGDGIYTCKGCPYF